jgi:hypothetical protein
LNVIGLNSKYDLSSTNSALSKYFKIHYLPYSQQPCKLGVTTPASYVTQVGSECTSIFYEVKQLVTAGQGKNLNVSYHNALILSHESPSFQEEKI